jgi:hypothetical protein
MKAILLNKSKQGLATMILAKPLHFAKELKTVTLSLSYTTRSHPDLVKGKDFTIDIDKTKETIMSLFRKGERDMAAYKYKIIWVNEMGEEQFSLVETEQDRNVKMQALADDGYSPVWREIE